MDGTSSYQIAMAGRKYKKRKLGTMTRGPYQKLQDVKRRYYNLQYFNRTGQKLYKFLKTATC